MGRLALLTLAAGILAAAPADDPAKKDFQQLQGTWEVVSAEMFGKPLSDKELTLEQIIIQGDRITLKERNRDGKAITFQLEPLQHPRQIDLVVTRDEEKKVWKGIYALEKDQLNLCLPYVPRGRPGGPPRRPEDFVTRNQANLLLIARRTRMP